MTTAFKRGVEKGVGYFNGLLNGGKAGGNAQYIGIVMGTSKSRELFCPTDCTADVRVLIGTHCNAVTTTANHNAKVGFVFF